MKKIKLFEEYIKESFKSGKLREIIKQNGYPTFSMDKRLLHDIQDRDVFCVLDDREEFYSKKFGENKDEKFKNTFVIPLKNGKVLVIKNFDSYKSYIGDDEEQFRYKIDNEINKRRGFNDKIHIDKLAKKRNNSVYDEQERRRFLNNFLTDEIKNEISKKIEDTISSIFVDAGDGNHEEEINNFEINGKEIFISINYSVSSSNEIEKFGAIYCDIKCTIDKITIYFDEDEIEADGFKDNIYSGETEFKEDDVETEITNDFEYYGVSPSDFF